MLTVRPAKLSKVERARMPTLLTLLGASSEMAFAPGTNPRPIETHHIPRTFWLRYEDHLDELAYELRKLHRQRVKEVRPDLVENHENAVIVSQVWSRVRRLMAARGIAL